jgi:hypothetical protein
MCKLYSNGKTEDVLLQLKSLQTIVELLQQEISFEHGTDTSNPINK